MKYGKIRKDDDGHTYVIPEDEVPAFDALNIRMELVTWASDEWYELNNEFNEMFSKYSVGGWLGDLKVVLE